MIAFFDAKKPISNSRHNIWVCLLLTVATLTVYMGVNQHAFISFDDGAYVSKNLVVRTGLTPENLAWAFSFEEKAGNYWQPLTWLSHMLDVDLYGLDPGRHHLTNVFFHIANAILLFLALNRMTGARWRSAFVAGLFALHPLNVESVAWLAERKNVLSTFFWMLTLLTYAFYNERPGRIRYAALLIVFTLGLLAKPMLVTLPFVLLLLDFWPLGRTGRPQTVSAFMKTGYRLVLEKIPLFLLSGLAVYLASASLRGLGSYIPLQSVPMSLRLENAIVSYVKYMGKMIWPEHLAVFYPYPTSIPMWQILGALIFVVGLSIFVLLMHKRCAYLSVGWFWFIGTMIPVIGLVQAGLWPEMADRWAYVPMVGLFMMISWGGKQILDRWRPARTLGAIASTIVLVALMVISQIQVGYWADSITIFEQAVKATDGSWVAHSNLGKALTDSGRSAEAFKHYAAAVRYNPNSAHAHLNFGSGLLARGKIDEAIEHFRQALQLVPNFPEVHNNMGLAMVRSGKIEAAINYFQQALSLNPNFANAAKNLKLATSINEQINRAARGMRASLGFRPQKDDLDLRMVELSNRKREVIDAVAKYRHALAMQPGYNGLAEINITAAAEVMQEYEHLLPVLLKAIQLQPASADAHYHVACIYSRKGLHQEARKWLEKAETIEINRRDFFLTDPDLGNFQ